MPSPEAAATPARLVTTTWCWNFPIRRYAYRESCRCLHDKGTVSALATEVAEAWLITEPATRPIAPDIPPTTITRSPAPEFWAST